MTWSALLSKWIYLVLVLVCQTARSTEGRPQAFTEAPSHAESSAQDSLSISRLIEAAYKSHELLPPLQWTDDHGIEQTDWNTTEQQESSSDRMMQYTKRKLLQVSSTTASMYRSADEKIVFPDSISSISSRTVLPALACHKSTYCENVVDYPRQLVNAAIARNASLKLLESVDPSMPDDDDDDIEKRIDLTDESKLCQFREQVIYPQKAQNKEEQWMFIVNQNDLKQGIRIEICLNDGQGCSIIDGFVEGYTTTCKQKFIYRELAALGSDGNIVKDQFRFPSSCCCHVKFIGDSATRLGLRINLSVNRTQYNRPSTFSTSTL